MERDESVRMACFLALDVLRGQLGDDLPYQGALEKGFAYRGRRVPFLNYQKGIYRAGVQRGLAALSINTSFRSPYDDAETDLGFLYASRFRSGRPGIRIESDSPSGSRSSAKRPEPHISTDWAAAHTMRGCASLRPAR